LTAGQIGNFGRYGTQGITATGSNQAVTKNLSGNYPVLIVGAAVRRTSDYNNNRVLIALRDNGTTQVDLWLSSSNRLYVTRNGTLLGSVSNFSVPLNSWVYLELKAKIDPTTGYIIVRANGVEVINLTNQNTRATANSFANQLLLQLSTGYGTDIWYDDVYVCDDSGTVNNNFLGDVRIRTVYPNAAGSATQWTPIGASANYQAVSEAQANDDTDYVASATAGQVDLYQFAALPAGQVFAVQSILTARKDDAGSRTIREKVRQGTTTYDGPTVPLGDSYQQFRNIRNTAPDGSTWSESIFNALEWGVELVS
ncbi:MAG: hypothetical protein C4321_09995, partial [Chloroflexota bacterium]